MKRLAILILGFVVMACHGGASQSGHALGAAYVAPIQLVYSVNGGPLGSGGVEVASGSTVQLSLSSLAGISTVLWEIYTAPDGYSTPSGWSLNGNSIQVTTPNGTPPPVFSIGPWGKYMVRATANNGLVNGVSSAAMVDQASGFELLSPSLGLSDVAFEESAQFNPKLWYGEVQKDLRIIEEGGLGGGGGGGGGGDGGGIPDVPSVNGNYVREYDGGARSWILLTQAAIAPNFTASLSGGTTYEIGQTVLNPSFTAAYSGGSPASASITNTDGVNSPHILSTPYTSATLAGSFAHSTNNSVVTFTLSATSTLGTGASATTASSWVYAIVCGTSTTPAATQAQYNALQSQTKNLRGSIGGSFACAASGTQFCMCGVPTALTLTDYSDPSGFTYTPGTVGSFTITNAQGTTVPVTFTTAGALGATTTFTLH